MPINPLWSAHLSELSAYVPGEQANDLSLIKLNTNENPYPPAPVVIDAIQQAAGAALRLYPDPDGRELKQAIAKKFKLSSAQVFLGNGSDEVLAHAFLALFKHPAPLLFPDISYSFYPVYCSLYQIEFEQIPLTANLEIDLDAYTPPNGGIIFPNPNAPTGHGLKRQQIVQLLERNRNSVVIVDEAYVDFGAESAVPLINDYPNILVVQTLSKSRSLAGLRVGYALGHSSLIEALELVKACFNSYPLDRLALAGAAAAINDEQYFSQRCAEIITSRNELAAALSTMGFVVCPSKANFLFVTHEHHSAATLQMKLREQNILVRHFDHPRIDNYLRITVGTADQCTTLLAALKDIVGA